jgi:hypothetical protein
MRNNLLFPNKTTCVRRIKNFEKYDAAELEAIWRVIVTHQDSTMRLIEQRVVHMLGRWQAYRNQRSPRNEHFLTKLVNNKHVRECLFRLVNAVEQSNSLHSVLRLEKESVCRPHLEGLQTHRHTFLQQERRSPSTLAPPRLMVQVQIKQQN